MVEGRGRHLETLMRSSLGLEDPTTVAAGGRNDRQVGRILNCLDWVEATTVETVEIVEEVHQETTIMVIMEVSTEVPVEAPDASAPHKPFTTMARPKETVEGIKNVSHGKIL